jgi:hypothetical protein
MKKFLLSCLLIASVSLIFAQTISRPCVADYKINNGGGNCPDVNGVSATGSVTLSFESDVDPAHVPLITAVSDITDPNNPVLVTGVTFGSGELLNNGDVKYCYYIGPNNNNNLLGHNSQFRFTVAYDINGQLFPCGTPITLPVVFKAFTASRSSNTVALKWTSASEYNNLGFEVQRLIGTGTWQTVSFVPTQAAGGNSVSELTYTYNDLNAIKGVSQYRIRQVDIDQRSKFSEIRAVRGIGQIAKTIIYPNPSTSGGKLNVIFEETEGTRDVSLIDMNGRLIKQWKDVTNNNLQIENLTPGFYNLRIMVRETGEQSIEKIVVNKN